MTGSECSAERARSSIVLRSILTFITLLSLWCPSDETILVDGAKLGEIFYPKQTWNSRRDSMEMGGSGNRMQFADSIGPGDFVIKARLSLKTLNSTFPHFYFADNNICFDSTNRTMHANGPHLGGSNLRRIGDAEKLISKDTPFLFELRRKDGRISVLVNNSMLLEADIGNNAVGGIGFDPGNNTMRIYSWTIQGSIQAAVKAKSIDAAEMAELQKKIDSAIDRGIQYLLTYQNRDGAWGYHANMFPAGQTALCIYTFLKCGLDRNHPALRRALAFIEQFRSEETYVLACMLMAYEALGDPALKPRIQDLYDLLASHEQRGIWSYPHSHRFPWEDDRGKPDLSNTQFAVLGLRAARKAGIDVPASTWKQILETTLKFQEAPRQVDITSRNRPEGTSTGKMSVAGFGYHNNTGVFGSMTAAGVSILKICQEHLGRNLTSQQHRVVDQAVEAGVNWLADNFTVTANPRHGDWLYYYLYGLERVGAFCKLDRIAGHDWYVEGAKHLVEKQDKNGSWSEYDHGEADTCFALLFLKRASSTVLTGGTAKPARDIHIAESPASDLSMRGSGIRNLKLWITGFGDAIKKTPEGTLRPVRIARVEYLVDGNVVRTVPSNATKPWAGEAMAVEYEFLKKGKYKVSARAHLLAPDAPDGAEPTITAYSPGFDLHVDAVMEDWMLPAAKARSRNLLLSRGALVSTSSQLNNGEVAPNICDGLESTRWLSAASDPRPTVTIQTGTPVKGNSLVITQAPNKDASLWMFDQITRIEIVVNNQKPIGAALESDPLKPTIIDLGRVHTISTLEVRITARNKNGSQPGVCGLSEVGIELKK